jgi:hypothetical protein
MRQSAIKELTAKGRRPVAGNGNLPVFNGEDNVNLSYRKLNSDFLNDRENAITRVVSTGAGAGDIGMMRPKQLLQMDVPKDRNYSGVLDMLNDNPYALQVTKIAQGAKHKKGPAEYAIGSLSYANHHNVGEDCFT